MKDLRQSRENTLRLEQIYKPEDLLKTKTIASHLIAGSEDQVKIEIRLYLEKAALSLDINIKNEQLLTLVDDILETYKYESLEDIREALKKGRRGLYGFGHNKRGSLNMLVIRDWLSKHLEEKAIIREKELRKLKELNKEPLQEVDYESYKARTKEDQTKKKAKERKLNPDSEAKYIAWLQDTAPEMNKEHLIKLRDQAKTLGRNNIVEILNTEITNKNGND